MKNLTLIIPAKNEVEYLLSWYLDDLNCKIVVSLEEIDTATIEAISKYKINIYKQKN